MGNYTLATVPHTGAVFTIGLLEAAGQTQGIDFKHWHWKSKVLALPEQPRALVTARNPHLSVIRTLYEGELFEPACNTWNNFIECLDFIDYFALDIGCREENRIDHVREALDFCELECNDAVIEYVSEWSPQNTSKERHGVEAYEHFRTDYLETGKLPDGYDWQRLDNAIGWYKSLPTNDYV
jgi:hypothetical protein